MSDSTTKTQAIGLLYTLAYNPENIRDKWRDDPVWMRFFDLDPTSPGEEQQLAELINDLTSLGRRAANSDDNDLSIWLQVVPSIKDEFVSVLFAPPDFKADFNQTIVSATPLAFLIGAILYNQSDRQAYFAEPESFIDKHLKMANVTGTAEYLAQLRDVFVNIGKLVQESRQSHGASDELNLSILPGVTELQAKVNELFSQDVLTTMAKEYQREQQHIW